MGQRHQAFLIARVRPHGAPSDHPGRRQCIAALHHQWCYGSLPLRAMRRLVSLVSQPDNAAVIRAEVRDIHNEPNHDMPVSSDTRCPFTTSLLVSAWSTDLRDESFYASQCCLLDDQMGCWDGDNNDGISVLDVTDPENPAYCFLTGYASHDEHPETQDMPLDAYGYLSAYYDLNEDPGQTADVADKDEADENARWNERLRKAVKDLAEVPVLRASMLREAWPYVRSYDPPRDSNAPSQPAPPPIATDASPGVVPNLADMSFDIAVQHSIDNGDTTDVEQVLWLPGKAVRAKYLLRDLEPFPDSAISLLSIVLKELKETVRVDLTGFQLSGTQVVAILCALNDARSVDLTDNRVIVADDIPDIAAAASSIRRIVLMGCPLVDGARLLELVRDQPSRFKTIEGILHPAFFTLEKSDCYPCAFACVSVTVPAYGSKQTTCVSIPFFTPAQIVQAIADIIPWQAGFESERMEAEFGALEVATAAFQGGTRGPEQGVTERTVMTVPRESAQLPGGHWTSLWAFVCRMPQHWRFSRRDEDVARWWGFVHYTRQVPDGTQDGVIEKTIYDFRGFLECMALEGRPMPSDEAVAKLEKILHMKLEATGEYCVPLMKRENLSEISY